MPDILCGQMVSVDCLCVLESQFDACLNPGTAIQALQRLAASNPMLYKALLHMKKDSDGCISAATLVQVSCNAVWKLMHAVELQQSQHTIKILEPANFASAETSSFIWFDVMQSCSSLSEMSKV